VATADATLPAERTRWRISVGDRADVVFQLRDYFRRLGVAAEVCKPTEVELTTEFLGSELAKYLADWIRVVDVPAKFVLRGAPLAEISWSLEKRPPRLGSLLVRKGFVSEEQIEVALNESRETGEMLGSCLLRKGLIFEEELARTLSDQLTVPYLSIGRIGVNAEVARLLPREVGERFGAIPVRAEEGGAVQVAFADPTDPDALEAVERYVDDVRIAVAELSDIRLAWRRFRNSST